jgi:sensor c-di-GMP phosphodiesterase-like protein
LGVRRCEGVRLERYSMDHFGTGYSLSYLKRLPADAIKVVKSFVKGFGEIEVGGVAEGVGGEEQARLLREMAATRFRASTSRSRCLPKWLRRS